MRIADRYIGWQVLYGTIFGVSLLTVVLVLGQDDFDRLEGKGLV